MERQSINGTLMADPKVLKLSPILLYVKLQLSSGQQVNCLVHVHALNFLYQAFDNSRVALFGHYNSRKQFIIEKYTVLASAKVAS